MSREDDTGELIKIKCEVILAERGTRKCCSVLIFQFNLTGAL